MCFGWRDTPLKGLKAPTARCNNMPLTLVPVACFVFVCHRLQVSGVVIYPLMPLEHPRNDNGTNQRAYTFCWTSNTTQKLFNDAAMIREGTNQGVLKVSTDISSQCRLAM